MVSGRDRQRRQQWKALGVGLHRLCLWQWHPCTIRFARDVGKILNELPKGVQPGTKDKFFMQRHTHQSAAAIFRPDRKSVLPLLG